jgi:hypothetical protein
VAVNAPPVRIDEPAKAVRERERLVRGHFHGIEEEHQPLAPCASRSHRIER